MTRSNSIFEMYFPNPPLFAVWPTPPRENLLPVPNAVRGLSQWFQRVVRSSNGRRTPTERSGSTATSAGSDSSFTSDPTRSHSTGDQGSPLYRFDSDEPRSEVRTGAVGRERVFCCLRRRRRGPSRRRGAPVGAQNHLDVTMAYGKKLDPRTDRGSPTEFAIRPAAIVEVGRSIAAAGVRRDRDTRWVRRFRYRPVGASVPSQRTGKVR